MLNRASENNRGNWRGIARVNPSKLTPIKLSFRDSVFQKLRDPNFKQLNYDHNEQQIKLFKENIKYLIYYNGLTVNEFFTHLNLAGVKILRKGFICGERNKPPSSLVITTFARLFGIKPGYLFKTDLPDIIETSEDWRDNKDFLPEPTQQP